METLIEKIKEIDSRSACMHLGTKMLILTFADGDDELSRSVRALSDEEPRRFRRAVRKLVDEFEKKT